MSLFLFSLGLFLTALAAAYALAALAATLIVKGQLPGKGNPSSAVSILKPLHGMEPRLYENLCSFCRQNHPDYQVIFGLHSASDSALGVARRVQREFSHVAIDVVVDDRIHGSNHKVSNLRNIEEHARHPLLVMADSDISVAPDYLEKVCAPLHNPQVGIVTCLYRSRPLGGLWSRLGGQFIDEWFVPSARLACLLGSRNFGFGATLALRKQTLQAVGGFDAVTDDLADDHRLAALTRELGLETVLSACVVTTDVAETTARALLTHELRWMRTIRVLNPPGYAFLVISFDVVLAAIGALLAGGAAPVMALFGISCAARAVLHYRQAPRQRHGFLHVCCTLPLVLLRDILNLTLWAIGFARRHVAWGGRSLHFDKKGLFRNHAN